MLNGSIKRRKAEGNRNIMKGTKRERQRERESLSKNRKLKENYETKKLIQQ